MRAQPGASAPLPARPGVETPRPNPGIAEKRRQLRRRFGEAARTWDRPARGSRHSPVGSIASLVSGTETTTRLSGAEMSSSSCAWRHAPRPGGKNAAITSGFSLKRRVRKAKAAGFMVCGAGGGRGGFTTVCACAEVAFAPLALELTQCLRQRVRVRKRRGRLLGPSGQAP